MAPLSVRNGLIIVAFRYGFVAEGIHMYLDCIGHAEMGGQRGRTRYMIVKSMDCQLSDEINTESICIHL